MVSVCMATYNGEKYLKEQLTSILCQLSEEDEIVISDDGSSDCTEELISSFHDNRIIYIHNSKEHGFVNNFENSLRHAQGDIVMLSDQDDIWEPNKVSIILEKLKQYDLVVHDAEMIDSDGKSLGKTYFSIMHRYNSFFANLWKTRWLGCCMAFKKEVLCECLPFPKKIVGHDYWIGMYGMIKFRYCFLDEVLIKYRRHGNNVSSSSEKSNKSLWFRLFSKRYYLLLSIFFRYLHLI